MVIVKLAIGILMKKANLIGRMLGYTLIEVLIVVFIISIVTSVALLSIGHNENKKLETFANELRQVVLLAEEQAMLQPNVLGIAFSDHAIQLVRYEASKENKWIPLDDQVLGKHQIPANINVTVNVQRLSPQHHELNPLTPQIIISSSGDITPFTIHVGKKGQKPRHAIIGDADGHLTQKTIS